VMAKTNALVEVLLVIPFVLTAWQFVNGLISYKFFEGTSKKLYVRVTGYTLVSICVFWGLFWALIIIGTSVGSGDLTSEWMPYILPVLWSILPFALGILALWYLIISIQDVYIILYKTI